MNRNCRDLLATAALLAAGFLGLNGCSNMVGTAGSIDASSSGNDLAMNKTGNPTAQADPRLFQDKKQAFTPDWLRAVVEDLKKQPKKNPPSYIVQFDYKGERVYYFVPGVLGPHSAVYDEMHNFLGSPDGGVDGRTYGSVGDFYEKVSNKKLIWEDKRP